MVDSLNSDSQPKAGTRMTSECGREAPANEKVLVDLLRVNVRTIQSSAEQGFVNLADFHIYSTVFYADSRSAIRFS